MTVSFSYKSTKIGFIITGVTTILALITLVIFGITPNKPTSSGTGYGGEAFPATLLAMANGCGDIYHIPPTAGQYGVIPEAYWELNEDPVTNIPIPQGLSVPMFGYMAEESLSDSEIRFYEPDEVEGTEPINRQLLLRTMYDKDITVIWYNTELNAVDLTLIREFVAASEQKVLAYPWTYGMMVGNRDIAFAKWGTSQTCALYSDEVLTEFIDFTEEHPIERINPVPEAEMLKDGTLAPIRAGGF